MKDSLGHDWEWRDSSHYDYVCKFCKKTDMDPGANRPCSPGKKTVKVEPGCLVRAQGSWWRVVKIIKDTAYDRMLILVASEGVHSTEYWEPQHIEDVKPYDGTTIEVEINERT